MFQTTPAGSHRLTAIGQCGADHHAETEAHLPLVVDASGQAPGATPPVSVIPAIPGMNSAAKSVLRSPRCASERPAPRQYR